MEMQNVSIGRWPVANRTRVRVRLGRYIVVGRIARVAPHAAGPPPGEWGVCWSHGFPGYGMRTADGSILYWRPIREY